MPERTETPYEDIGSHARPGPYDEVRHLKCPVCHAGPDQRCVNPVTGRSRKAPCVGRKERSSVPGEERRQ